MGHLKVFIQQFVIVKKCTMRLSLRKTIVLSILSLNFSSCLSSKLVTPQENEMYKVINSTLVLNPSNPMKIYERSYIGKEYNANFIRDEVYNIFVSYAYSTEIYQTNAKSSKAIESSEEISVERKRVLLDSINLNLKLSVSDFLSERDRDYMSKMADKKLKWNPQSLTSKISLTNDTKAIRISVPVFNQDHTISAYFLGSPNGLELIFCKKDEAGEWYRFAESLVWIS